MDNGQQTTEQVDVWLSIVAETMARHGRIAVSKTEAAELLGVSTEFFDEHVAGEVNCVRRGRRVIFPVYELFVWLCRASGASAVPNGPPPDGDAPS